MADGVQALQRHGLQNGASEVRADAGAEAESAPVPVQGGLQVPASEGEPAVRARPFNPFTNGRWKNERVCQCGCNQRYSPTSKNQKYRLECSKRVSRARHSNSYKKQVLSAAKVAPGTSPMGSRAAHLDPERRRIKICMTCYNLPHARPSTGCEKCGLPYGS